MIALALWTAIPTAVIASLFVLGHLRLRDVRAGWKLIEAVEFHYDDAEGKRTSLPASALTPATIEYLTLNRKGSYDA